MSKICTKQNTGTS